MSDNITKRVGLGTAYGFAKAGGYEGTVEQFTELLGNIAIDLARIENLSVTVTTLPAGSQATASLNGSVLSLGIPKGDKGDKGNTGNTPDFGIGTVTTLSAGSSATASITGTAENPVLNLGIPQGEAGAGAAGVTASAYSSSSAYAVGDYVIHNSNLYRCTTAITTAEAFTAAHWTQVVLGDDVSDLKSNIDEIVDSSINLLNPNDFQVGKYLVVGGGLSDNSNLTASGFFPVSGGVTYHVYRSDTYAYRVAYYTSADESSFVSLDDSVTVNSFTTPNTAKYARVSTNKTMILDMGVYSSDIGNYIPYALRLSESLDLSEILDKTLSVSDKAADAKTVGDIVKYVVTPEKSCKYGDSTMHINERLDLDDGKIVTGSSGQTRTDYIPVNVGDYIQTCAIRDVCLYDDNYQYLGYINLWSTNDAVTPPDSWSGNYNSNITQITKVNNVSPKYIRCWGRDDLYPPAVTVLTDEPYKVVNLGDSIFGNNEKPWDLGTYIQNISGMKDANCGYGGTTARVIPSGGMSPLGLPSIVDCIVAEDFTPLKTPAYWASLQEYRYTAPTLLFSMVDFSKVDIITIAYGTNDYNSDTPLDNENNKFDTSTYCGGLRYAIKNLLQKYPAITIILLSPIYRYWSSSQDYSTVDQDSDSKKNLLNLKVIDYVNAMKAVAEEYHLPFFDNYNGVGLNQYTAPTWLRDGTHLNRGIGVDKLGHIIAKEVSEVY